MSLWGERQPGVALSEYTRIPPCSAHRSNQKTPLATASGYAFLDRAELTGRDAGAIEP